MVASTGIMAKMEEDLKGSNFVIEADELLEIREKISMLYFKRKVIVSPCLSKLYFRIKNNVTDHTEELKSTPNWLYLATGLVTVIYDDENNDVKLAFFDRHSAYLHWSLKWDDFVSCQMSSSNVQIINTDRDNQEDVRIVYENQYVAELIEATVSLFYSSIQLQDYKESRDGRDDETNTPAPLNKPLLRATRSDALLKLTKHSSFDAGLEENKNDLRRSSLRGSLPRKLGRKLADEFRRKDRSASLNSSDHSVLAQRAINKTMPEPLLSDCPQSGSTSSLFSRADMFRRNRSQSLDCDSNQDNDNCICTGKKDKLRRQKSIGDNSNKDSMIKLLFKKRRISRTQSLKMEDEKELMKSKGQNDYERPVRLQKPRSHTEPVMPKDDTKILVEAALAARDGRERKQYGKNLSNGKAATTNLCDTDL